MNGSCIFLIYLLNIWFPDTHALPRNENEPLKCLADDFRLDRGLDLRLILTLLAGVFPFTFTKLNVNGNEIKLAHFEILTSPAATAECDAQDQCNPSNASIPTPLHVIKECRCVTN